MREFIKTHPWRFEVVPFVVVALAFMVPVLGRQEALAQMHSVQGFGVHMIWLLRYTLRGAFLVSLWALGLSGNYSAAKYGVSRGRYICTFFTAGLGLTAWFMSQWMFVTTWVPVVLVAVAVEALTERTRPIDRAEHAERPVNGSVRDGDLFYYREDRNFRGTAVILALYLTFFRVALWTTFGNGQKPVTQIGSIASFRFWFASAVGNWGWFDALLVAALWVLLICWLCRSTLVVSNRTIKMRGFVGKEVSIPIESVRKCEAHEGLPPLSSGSQAPGAYLLQSGPCLSIETADSRRYIINAKHPDAVCRLIERAMAARDEEGGE